MNLQQYFQEHASIKHTIEHEVGEDYSVKVRIYPTGVEGHARAFQVKGNELIPIERKAPDVAVGGNATGAGSGSETLGIAELE